MSKKSAKIIGVILICMNIALIGAVVFALRSPLPLPLPLETVFRAAQDPMPEREIVSPDALLLQYFEHAENGRFEDMYAMLTAASRDVISREDFVERNRNIYEGIGAGNIVAVVREISEVADRPGRKIVTYAITMDTVAGEISFDNQAVFERDSGSEYRLQWDSTKIFPELGDSDRVRVNILHAERGRIYDRYGDMLAGPGTASAVGFIPGRMIRDEISLEPDEDDIAKVAELLEMTPEGIIRRLNASYVRDDVFVQLRIIPRDAQDLIDELLTVQGIMVSTAHVRYYPLGRSAAHLVGYVQNINAEELEARRDYGYHMNSVIGRTGLERMYEDILRARDGREIFILNTEGNRTTTLAHTPPQNGQNIRLTIDAHIQQQVYEKFSGDKSASVVTNPLTGEVLALVSTPSYDPNEFVRGMRTSVWSEIYEDENLPLFNRFRATFSPGSTMKPITAAIGLDAGAFRYDENFGQSGLRWQQDASWGRFFVTTVREYDGPANLNNAMAWSDNIYFAKAALRIGADAFANGLANVGFGDAIPFEYALFRSSVSQAGGFTSDIQLADSGYGQGEIQVNPVHLAAIYSAFVNDGDIIAPRLFLDEVSEIWLPRAFSPETAELVLNSLIFSVEVGTGRNAQLPGVVLGGKTGTAEIKLAQDDETGTEIGWFVMLTVDETDVPLLVASMVEDVHGRGGSGYVVPLVAELFRSRLF
ncbi:MAG: penicillin-binding transpeptidase domain-containing protein [Defluviitaleaceae bacterium]|nr:penicillin-binding transpeptidase domain-containing protein [Defluviitaleaceae bacterium]